MSKYNKIVIGLDQSYKNTGISFAADDKLKKVSSIHLENVIVIVIEDKK